MSDTNISVGKTGNITANDNKGVINLLAVSREIQNSIADLPSSSAPNQPNIKKLIENLCEEIQKNTELSDKQKEKALKQVKNLVEATKERDQPDFQERVDTAITMIQGIVSGVSSAVGVCKLLTEIATLFGII